MKITLTRILFAVSLFLFVAQPVMAQKIYKFKISVNTVMDHPRNQGLLLFMEDIKKKSGGRLNPELFHSAQLYKGGAVLKALKLGTLEMGAPTTGYLTSYNINTCINYLPMFYGRSPETIRKFMDSGYWEAIARSIEKKMGVKVLGRFYELGYVHILTTNKPIEKLADFKGLKIRYPTSPEFALRIKAFGANPMRISLSDLSMALLQGTVDGTITNFKGADATKLDDSHIKYAVKEYGALAHYMPIVSNRFWNSLPQDLQKIMVNAWEDSVDKQRKVSAKMQLQGEMNLEKRGVKIYRPSQEELTKWRNHILPVQAPFVKKMKYDENFINQAKKILGM
jgi:C4-dicarboxylate-binding protein DctP